MSKETLNLLSIRFVLLYSMHYEKHIYIVHKKLHGDMRIMRNYPFPKKRKVLLDSISFIFFLVGLDIVKICPLLLFAFYSFFFSKHQFLGDWDINHPDLESLCHEVVVLRYKFDSFTIAHIDKVSI